MGRAQQADLLKMFQDFFRRIFPGPFLTRPSAPIPTGTVSAIRLQHVPEDIHLSFLFSVTVSGVRLYVPVVPHFDVVNFADFSVDVRGRLC